MGDAVPDRQTGVDLVLVVTEPTLSGIHDLERILDVADHFKVKAMVCINKYDLNKRNAVCIERECEARGVEIVGRLPYDDVATKAMLDEKSVIEFSDGDLSSQIRSLWMGIEEVVS